MNHFFKQFIILTFAVTLLYMLVVACAAPAAPAAAPAAASTATPVTETRQDTVVLAINAPTESLILDPVEATDSNAVYAAWLLYDSLMYSTTEGVKIGLAEKVDISEDGTTYTFTLRPNVTFQDSTPLTASNVVWSWEYIQNKIHAQQLESEFPEHGKVTSVTAVDDLTVQIILSEPSDTFLANVITKIPIVKESSNESLQGNVIGTGPFQFVNQTSTGTILLEANPTYWNQEAIAVKQIELIAIADNNEFLSEWNNQLTDTHLSMDDKQFLESYYDIMMKPRPRPCPRPPFCNENPWGEIIKK